MAERARARVRENFTLDSQVPRIEAALVRVSGRAFATAK
jgi:hypothetical protein